MKKICNIEDCKNLVKKRNLCNKHYLRLWKYGNPLITKHREKCEIEGCDNKHLSKGYCKKHYMRWDRTNDPLLITRKEPIFGSLKERFEKSYIINVETGCWDWIKLLGSYGYAHIQSDSKNLRGHRVSYKIYKGKIKKGMFILHKCDNRRCVNPDHLYMGTQANNMKDMVDRDRHPIAKKGIRPIAFFKGKNQKLIKD